MKKANILIELLTLNLPSKIAFLVHYWRGISKLRNSYHRAYDAYAKSFSGAHDPQEATVRALLLNAFNSLLLSSNLLIQCTIVPSGNLMRNFIESVCAAIVFSSRKLAHYAKYDANQKKYRIDTLVDEIQKPNILERLNLDPQWARNMSKIKNFYHLYSHASTFSASFMANFSTNKILLGSFYDKQRGREYRIELIRRITACKLLRNVVLACKDQLEE